MTPLSRPSTPRKPASTRPGSAYVAGPPSGFRPSPRANNIFKPSE